MMASKSLLYSVATADRFQENYNTLDRQKEELKKKLAVKIEVCHLARYMFIAEIQLNCISFRPEKRRLMDYYGVWLIESD